MTPQAANQHGDATKPCTDTAATEHLIVASNRGPFSFGEKGEASGVPTDVPAAKRTTWVSVAATPGDRKAAEAAENGVITAGLPGGHAARLATPSRRALHRYYNIICNPLLWFLHHRSWGFTHTPNIDREAHTAWEQGFVTVNQLVADEIVAEAGRSGEQPSVLLRDYHLHLVAGVVREKLPEAQVRYAPNVPWPGPSDWSMLPAHWRAAIFESLIACDTIELTSLRDVRTLLSCFAEFLPDADVDLQNHQVTANRHTLRLEVKNQTIDADAVQAVADSHRCETFVRRFEEDPRHTIVTTDRTEPHKNIVRCIRAFGNMLDQDRSLAEDARYLVVLAPPPAHLSQYRRYASEIEKAANDVNRKHRADTGKPVELIVENNYPMALAAMAVADTLVSVPIADAACATQLSTPLINRQECTLVLSETSTAAEIFGNAAEKVAPSDVEAIKSAMLRSIEMPDDERDSRFAEIEAIAYRHTDASTGES